MKYEIPAMVGAGGGAIVNTASVAGLVGERGIGAYSASKHGVVGLTRTAALDYIGQGVRINAVCPGATRTRILASWFQDPKVESFILSRHPIGGLLSRKRSHVPCCFLRPTMRPSSSAKRSQSMAA